MVEIDLAGGQCTVKIRALPLPATVTRLLEENAHLIKTLSKFATARLTDKLDRQVISSINEDTATALNAFKGKLNEAFESSGDAWADGVINRIWSFGPRRNATNILLNRTTNYVRPSIWNFAASTEKNPDLGVWAYDSSVVSGFQIAAQTGPLCEEPMMGVCFVIERWEIDALLLRGSKYITDNGGLKQKSEPNDLAVVSDKDMVLENDVKRLQLDPAWSEDSINSKCESRKPETSCGECEPSTRIDNNVHRQFTGQLMSSIKDGCRRAFQSQPQRLMWAMYTCDIQATADVLGW